METYELKGKLTGEKVSRRKSKSQEEKFVFGGHTRPWVGTLGNKTKTQCA
jgi:hypothetical protein